MPRNKGAYNDSFDIFKDSKGKERYKCRKCGKDWAKNETRLQEHYNSCILTENIENRISSGFKRQYQATVDNFVYKLSKADQKNLESLFAQYGDINIVVQYLFNQMQYFSLITDGWSNINNDSIINYMVTTPKPIFYKSITTKEEQHTANNIVLNIETIMLEAHAINLWIKDILKIKWAKTILEKCKGIVSYFKSYQTILATLRPKDNLRIDSHIQILIINDSFWKDLKYLCDLLKPFLMFIHLLEQDNPLLSVVYIKLLDIKAGIHKNQQVSKTFCEEVLQLEHKRWIDFLFNPAILDHIIEEEIIRLAGLENEDKALSEFAEYIGKTGAVKENPQNWRNLVKAKYPILCSVAFKVLSIPATSTAISDLKKTGAIIEKEISDNMIDNEVNTSENLIFEDGEWMLNENMSFEYNEENFEEDVEDFKKYSEKSFEKNFEEQFNEKYHEDYENSETYSEEDFEEYYESNFTTNLEDDY
ncbi:2632_t:CDS:2 [Scutellospora calospora]|uniref:2632_t:CDS:1 n=1 Tax=Scutellospora calospora TaxID=85575 RepID=A0ACA9KFL4_9GLOM|nr:2632_t:CDS:2 [Scutellospora calospora]